jgi:hypothetical protein
MANAFILMSSISVGIGRHNPPHELFRPIHKNALVSTKLAVSLYTTTICYVSYIEGCRMLDNAVANHMMRSAVPLAYFKNFTGPAALVKRSRRPRCLFLLFIVIRYLPFCLAFALGLSQALEPEPRWCGLRFCRRRERRRNWSMRHFSLDRKCLRLGPRGLGRLQAC